MSDTDFDKDLIAKLTGEHEPVKPMMHPLKLMMPLIIASVSYVIAVAWMIGMRGDFMLKVFEDIVFTFELSLAFGIFCSAAITLVYLAFPDMRGKEWVRAVPLTLSGVFVFWAGLRFAYETPLILDYNPDCFLNGIVFLFVPMIALTFCARLGATTRPIWSTAMAVLAFSAIGWIGLRLTCGMDHFVNALLFDFSPFVVSGILIGAFARRIFNW